MQITEKTLLENETCDETQWFDHSQIHPMARLMYTTILVSCGTGKRFQIPWSRLNHQGLSKRTRIHQKPLPPKENPSHSSFSTPLKHYIFNILPSCTPYPKSLNQETTKQSQHNPLNETVGSNKQHLEGLDRDRLLAVTWFCDFCFSSFGHMKGLSKGSFFFSISCLALLKELLFWILLLDYF